MPSWKITAPDGHSYKVTGDDLDTHEAAVAAWEANQNSQGSGTASSSVNGNGGSNPPPAIPTDPYSAVEQFGEDPGTAGSAQKDFAKGVISAPARMNQTLERYSPLGMATGFLKDKVLPESVRQYEQRATQTPDSTAGRVGSFVGDVAMTTPAIAATPARMLPQVGMNAALGAGMSPDNPATGAAWGGAGGAVGHVLSRALGGIVQPTAEAQALMDKGITLTPGQAAGKHSFANRVEQQLSSLPVAGHAIQNLRRGSLEDLNRQVISDSSMRGVANYKGMAPREALEASKSKISDEYSRALQDVEASGTLLWQDMNRTAPTILANHDTMRPEDARSLAKFVERRLEGKLGRSMNGEELKALDSEIGTIARGYANSLNQGERFAAPAWYELQGVVRDTIKRGATKSQGELLDRANQAYRRTIPISKAIGTGDVATPLRLRAEIEKQPGHPSTELVRAAQNVLPGTVPNSGTAERLIVSALPSLLLGGGAGANAMGWDTVGTGMMAAGALGSRPGARFMTGQSALNSQALAEALRNFTPAATRSASRKRGDD